MRIVATSDTHFPVDTSLIPDGDVFIHAGDLLEMGDPSEWYECSEWLADLPHKRKIFVPGNHDFYFMHYPGPAFWQMQTMGFEVLGHPLGNATTELPNGMTVLGIPFIKDKARWAFNSTELEVYQHIMKYPADIVVSHVPIANVLDVDWSGFPPSGFESYIIYLRQYQPKLWIHGHVHETYGHERVLKTDVYNVSLCDRQYRHINPPLVIDID
jgi:calcineurin-like phosphoesterase family protein